MWALCCVSIFFMNNVVLVSGSLAYDRIMDFSGTFRDHIMPDKIHMLSLSFQVDTFEERFGGTAGNIAYTLKLLGCEPKIFAAVGEDFDSYEEHLKKCGIDTAYITRVKRAKTASAYIITDHDDNQIAAFYPGALGAGVIAQKIVYAPYAIVSPEQKGTMIGWVKKYQSEHVPYIFDPGQQMTNFTGEELRDSIEGAFGVIGNDYEIELLLRMTGYSLHEVAQRVKVVVITYGKKGSKVYSENKVYDIKAIKPAVFVDPTGAGDAYRAGFIAGLVEGKSFEECGRLASLVAARAIEHYGA